MNRTGTGHEKQTSFPLKDEVYIRRLKHDIDALKVYHRQADIALEKLESEAAQFKETTDPDYIKKLDYVALYDSSGRIPFISGRDEVLDVALASCILQDRLKETKDTTQWLESEIEISREYLSIDHYQLHSHDRDAHVDRIDKLKAASTRLDNKIQTLNQSPAKYVEEKSLRLEELTSQAMQWNQELTQHLKRVALKHLAIQNWNNNQRDLNKSDLREAVHETMKTLQLLLHSQPSAWITILLDPPHLKVLLEALASNGVIEIQSESDSATSQVRLRDFLEI